MLQGGQYPGHKWRPKDFNVSSDDLIFRGDALQEVDVVISVESFHVLWRAQAWPEYLHE